MSLGSQLKSSARVNRRNIAVNRSVVAPKDELNSSIRIDEGMMFATPKKKIPSQNKSGSSRFRTIEEALRHSMP